MLFQRVRIGGSLRWCSQPAQTLVAKTFQRLPSHVQTQLGVVAPLFMCIQRQVIGQQVDVVRQQQGQSLLHPTGDGAVLPAPEQAMVNQQSVRAFFNSRFNQRFAGCHA